MVGLVIVSHSARLAEGVKQLADQMTQGAVKIAVAGGIDDPDNPIGTDPFRVQKAIESVFDGDGVVVFMDLGSALLSAEMALEFLPSEMLDHVFLSSAPLVEGVMSAAVQAAAGSSVEQVLAEAESALAIKTSHLAGAIPTGSEKSTAPPANTSLPTQQFVAVIANEMGLHARPAALLVRTAGQFDAEVLVSKAGKTANAKSINQIATLSVRRGDEITVSASGPQAEAALGAIQQLIDDNFGEPLTGSGAPAVSASPVAGATTAKGLPGTLTGIPASPGIAIGPALIYRPTVPEVTQYAVEDSAAEWKRLEEAINDAVQTIDGLYQHAVGQVGADKAAIFEAHALILRDPVLLETVKNRLYADHENAEWAWKQEIANLADTYRKLDSQYLQARAADVEDVGGRVLENLLGVAPPSLDLSEPSIIIAADLSPSDTARLDPEKVLGLCTEFGGATAHSAILARSLGIPAVVGLGHDVWQIVAGALVAIDGEAGVCWPKPDSDQVAQLQEKRAAWQAQSDRVRASGQNAAATSDGFAIEVAANVGGPDDIPRALEFGAEGVGLFRTEFLFLDRDLAPTEDEQYEAYCKAAKHLDGKPLIIRTLDVGGDKPIPYLGLPEEANPFLGWRGIRFCLDKPEVFKPQLRAILRASSNDKGQPTRIKMMFPMVGTLAEVRAARRMLVEVQEDLRAEGVPFDERMEVGIMIEVPAAVASADQLAREVDFFSIGTNDLTQYVMAADRGNSKVATLVNALQPAVLRMIKQTADAGRAAGIWTGMCGELAGNPLATPLLIGMGLTELSMSAPAIPLVKEALRSVSMAEARQMAHDVLELPTAEAVAAFLQRAQS